MRLLALRLPLTCASIVLYLTWCWYWNGLGGGSVALGAAPWLLLWVSVKRIWDLGWATAFVVGLGAGLSCFAWSFGLLDPPLREVGPYEDCFVYAPFVLALLAGATLRERGISAATLAIVLAVAAFVPMQIWRSESPVGGWSQEPYLQWLSGVLWVLVPAMTFGFAAGSAGSGLKLLWAAARKRREGIA